MRNRFSHWSLVIGQLSFVISLDPSPSPQQSFAATVRKRWRTHEETVCSSLIVLLLVFERVLTIHKRDIGWNGPGRNGRLHSRRHDHGDKYRYRHFDNC